MINLNAMFDASQHLTANSKLSTPFLNFQRQLNVVDSNEGTEMTEKVQTHKSMQL